MKYDDLKAFTWDELSYFEWRDLLQERLDLLKQVDQNATIPEEIATKLYDLCQEVVKEVDSPEAEKLKNVSMKRFGDVILFLDIAITVSKVGLFIHSTNLASFLVVLEDLTKYIPRK